MPAVSKAQRKAMAIAKHHPEKLYARNRGLLRMSKEKLRKYASTSEKRLPTKKKGILKHRGKYRPREKRHRKRRT